MTGAMSASGANLGLYLHLPYCKAICHYCDFAKTANFTAEHGRRYLAKLEEHLAGWIGAFMNGAPGSSRPAFTSVFLGGGTPSLFAAEYTRLFAMIRPVLAPDAEVTIEANPDDVTAAKLSAWRDLGVNRLSLGVQTFDPAGLMFLRRAHDADTARRAAALARATFGRLNLDLIYGWGDQGHAGWRRDIEAAIALGATHLSLYTLTYETRTPIGRAAARGRLRPQDDDRIADLYRVAVDAAGAAGLEHEEVSNWARPGNACRHNWGYWEDQPYVGIGAGAHGYLRTGTGPGIRYAYGRDDRAFLRRAVHAADVRVTDGSTLAGAFGVAVEPGRTPAVWLTDYVGSALRTRKGVRLDRIAAETGAKLSPTPALAAGLATGAVRLLEAALVLDPGEWFRETAWAVELLRSLPLTAGHR